MFLQAEKRYSKWTIGAYRIDLKQFSRYLLSMYELKDLEKATYLEIRSWIVSLMQQKISARSVNRKVSVLKSFYKYLIIQGVLKKSPLAKVILPKVSVKIPVYVEKENMENVLKNV